MEKVTVKQMIETLKRFDENAPFEIAIKQYNKVFPVAYVQPSESSVEGHYADMRDGKTVRIYLSLPSDENKFMYTAERKL